jgi:hypothetical protein
MVVRQRYRRGMTEFELADDHHLEHIQAALAGTGHATVETSHVGPGEDGGPTATYTRYDFDGDGNVDLMVVDEDSDGRPETIYRDIDDNGHWDEIQHDYDEDGRFENVWRDTDHNGYIDTIETDTNGDGHPEVIQRDTDGDGRFDTVAYDRNSDGHPEVIGYDTDGDGHPDRYLHVSDVATNDRRHLPPAP